MSTFDFAAEWELATDPKDRPLQLAMLLLLDEDAVARRISLLSAVRGLKPHATPSQCDHKDAVRLVGEVGLVSAYKAKLLDAAAVEKVAALLNDPAGLLAAHRRLIGEEEGDRKSEDVSGTEGVAEWVHQMMEKARATGATSFILSRHGRRATLDRLRTTARENQLLPDKTALRSLCLAFAREVRELQRAYGEATTRVDAKASEETRRDAEKLGTLIAAEQQMLEDYEVDIDFAHYADWYLVFEKAALEVDEIAPLWQTTPAKVATGLAASQAEVRLACHK